MAVVVASTVVVEAASMAVVATAADTDKIDLRLNNP
jgi:hypothetical protein